MKPLVQNVKTVTGEKTFYLNLPDCKICNAVSKDGKDLRMLVDKYLITHTPAETMKYLRNYNVNVTVHAVQVHLNKHSKYILDAIELVKKTAENLALSRMDKIQEKIWEAEDVIKEIIMQGGQRLQSGELKVDSKLLLGALKEEGARKKFGTLQEMFMELDKGRFIEGEIKEELDEELELPSGENKI